MGGSLNVNHLMFLGYGALWTIGLSLIGLLGGGLAGFIIALCRISPSRIPTSPRTSNYLTATAATSSLHPTEWIWRCARPVPRMPA